MTKLEALILLGVISVPMIALFVWAYRVERGVKRRREGRE